MKGTERLASVESTTPRMARALPEMPMDGTVLVRLIRISAFGMGNFFEPVFRELVGETTALSANAVAAVVMAAYLLRRSGVVQLQPTIQPATR